MLKSLRYGKEFEELYTGNYSRLYYYAYQFLNDAEVSRDVVNDAFEYVWKNYENFRKMNVVAILFQSVRNKSIDIVFSDAFGRGCGAGRGKREDRTDI